MDEKTYNVSLKNAAGEHVLIVTEFNGLTIGEENARKYFEEYADKLSKSGAFAPGVSLGLFDDDDYHGVAPLAVRVMG